jgi:ATP-independent RNA helicase DbpA
MLNTLNKDKAGVQALIMVPSRELALQIEQVFRQMGTGFKISCCYGGHSSKTEKNSFEEPPAVLVGTPGRIAFHVDRRSFNPYTVTTLVLDEFDKALEFGFQDDMSYIIREMPRIDTRILTSATNAIEIPSFAGVRSPIELNYLTDAPLPTLALKAVSSKGKEKLDTAFSLICKVGDKPTLVFCNHREAVERISEVLKEKGLIHDIFHGGMEQDDRERTLIKFRNGSNRILLTTDLASRGLDIPEIESVIHYQLPPAENAFIHRNGRTARMHASGSAYIILAEDEKPPFYVTADVPFEPLTVKTTIPKNSDWSTIYIAAGKKDKVNKIDIVGMLMKKGGLEKDELGIIEVKDHSSYVAVKTSKAHKLVQELKNEKIKGSTVKIELSR